MSNTENIKLFGKGKIWSRDQIQSFVHEEITHWNETDKLGVFAVFHKASNVFMGILFLYHVGAEFATVNKLHQNSAEIGYIIDKAFWGNKYGTEIAIVGKKYIKHIVFHEPKNSPLSLINEITATAHPDNISSSKILKRHLKHYEPIPFERERFDGNKRILYYKFFSMPRINETENVSHQTLSAKL